jgi:hypothetical protein
MKPVYSRSAWIVLACTVGIVCPSAAIEAHPPRASIQAALDRGKHAAAQHQSPDMFYTRFGATDDGHSGGFLMTKLGGVSVMAAHMALRGLDPSTSDIAQVADAPTMLVSIVIFGDTPSFAEQSYMVLDQGDKTIKPITVRADGQASRRADQPTQPRFQAKVVASFAYADFDPRAKTTITVFPASGGEVRFAVDFAHIE